MFRFPTAWLAGHSLKARLIPSSSSSGCLPVLGVLLALAAFENARIDHAALDRASRGTIHLKHINGLVYAIVMESRGIYMSADWKVAEPFAQKLTAQLAELQQTAAAWKAEPIPDRGPMSNSCRNASTTLCASAPSWYGLERREHGGGAHVR